MKISKAQVLCSVAPGGSEPLDGQGSGLTMPPALSLLPMHDHESRGSATPHDGRGAAVGSEGSLSLRLVPS